MSEEKVRSGNVQRCRVTGRLLPMKPSRETLAQIQESYTAGDTCHEIAAATGICAAKVLELLRGEGVRIRSKADARPERRNLAPAEEQEVATRYREGKTANEIARIFKVNRVCICRTLRILGEDTRPPTETSRKYTLNESVFDEPLSEEGCYFAGLLMADGCVTNPRPGRGRSTVTLGLTWSDRDTVFRFRDFLQTDTPIRRAEPSTSLPNCSPSASLTVHSERLAIALRRFGVVPRKSKIAKVKRLEKNRHFWRGMVDGDGWVSVVKRYDSPVIGFTGSLACCEQFRAFCSSITPHRTCLRRNHSIWSFSTCGPFAYQVIQAMYANASVALNRKASLAAQILDRYRGRYCF